MALALVLAASLHRRAAACVRGELAGLLLLLVTRQGCWCWVPKSSPVKTRQDRGGYGVGRQASGKRSVVAMLGLLLLLGEYTCARVMMVLGRESRLIRKV